MKRVCFVLVTLLLVNILAHGASLYDGKVDRSQSYYFKASAVMNTLALSHYQSGVTLRFDDIYSKGWGFGLQSTSIIGLKKDRRWAYNTDIKDVKISGELSVYGIYQPLYIKGHALTLNLGYSFGLYAANNLSCSNSESLLHQQTDHGVMGRIAYDYIFDEGLTLGAFVQYTNFLQHRSTQDILNIGISIGWQF